MEQSIMKKITCAFISAMAVAALTGCACSSSCETRNIIRDDINAYMEEYGNSVEVRPCEFSSVSAEKLFAEIPAINQQKNFKTLVMEMESIDGKAKVRTVFAAGEKVKLVISDSNDKIIVSFILKDNKVYRSTDGIEYQLADSRIVPGFRLLYDTTMNLAAVTKNVSVQTFDAYNFGKQAAKREMVKEPLEIMMNDTRCYRIDLSVKTRSYETDLVFYVAADDTRNIIRSESIPGKGLEGIAQKQTNLNSRFLTQNGFVFPGLSTIINGDQQTEMLLKKVTVNQPVPESEFTPDVLK